MKWTQLTFKQLNERKRHAKKNSDRAGGGIKPAATNVSGRAGARTTALEKVSKIQN